MPSVWISPKVYQHKPLARRSDVPIYLEGCLHWRWCASVRGAASNKEHMHTLIHHGTSCTMVKLCLHGVGAVAVFSSLPSDAACPERKSPLVLRPCRGLPAAPPCTCVQARADAPTAHQQEPRCATIRRSDADLVAFQ